MKLMLNQTAIQARLVLLGASIGELGGSAQAIFFISRVFEAVLCAGYNHGLLDVDGIPLVNHWLIALRACSRLLPLSQKVGAAPTGPSAGQLLCWARPHNRPAHDARCPHDMDMTWHAGLHHHQS